MKKYRKILIFCFLFVLSFSFVACEKKDEVSISNKNKIKQIKFPNEKDNNIDLKIYFADNDSESDSDIAKEERLLKKEEIIGELIMQELIKGPAVKGSLKPIFPKETRLLSFSIKDSVAYVNLSKEAYHAPMSYNNEKAYLKCIVWSLTQLPSVEKVKLLIENKNINNLTKNFDLSKPIERDDLKSDTPKEGM